MALPQNEYVAFLDELAQANLDIALRRVQNDLDEDPDPESSRERMRLEMEWETHWTPLTAEQTPPFMEASATLVLQCREDGIGTLAQSQELMAVIKKGADKASVEDDSTRQE